MQNKGKKGANAVQLDTGESEVEDLIDCLLIKVNLTSAMTPAQGYPTTTIQAEIEGVPLELSVDSMADAKILGENHLCKLDKVV